MSERDESTEFAGSSQRARGGRALAILLTAGAGVFAGAGTLLLLLGTFWLWPISVGILCAATRWSTSAVGAWMHLSTRTRHWTSWTVAFGLCLFFGVLAAVVPLRAAGIVQQEPWVTPYLCSAVALLVFMAIFGFSRFAHAIAPRDRVRLD